MTAFVPANPITSLPKPHFASAGVMVEVEDANGRLVDDRALARIEELDDTIFDALEGDAEALDRAAKLWGRIQKTAPVALVEESREQYVRRALAVAEEYELSPAETLGKRFASLEVLALLAD